MKALLFAAIVICLTVFQSVLAQSPAPAEKSKQFIYVLRLVPRLYDDKAWTDRDEAAVQEHFNLFKEVVKSGQLILAGRTLESGDKTFGIEIFEAADENVAREFMTAELHPFGVALERKSP